MYFVKSNELSYTLDVFLSFYKPEEIKHTGILRRHIVIRGRYFIPDMRNSVLFKEFMVSFRELADYAVSRSAADNPCVRGRTGSGNGIHPPAETRGAS